MYSRLFFKCYLIVIIIFCNLSDLSWDSWVIHPLSLTFVQCALCNPAEGTVQCPSSSSGVQDASSQVGIVKSNSILYFQK